MKKRFTDEQIIGILREAEVGAMSIKALCKKHNLTEQTLFPLAQQVRRHGRACCPPAQGPRVRG